MNCEQALRLWEFARPGATELDAGDIADLENHLAMCPACSAFSRDERAWDDEISANVRATMPSSVAKDQLWQRLIRQRRTWWLRRAIQTAIALMIGVIAVGIWPAPSLGVDVICARNLDQMGNQEGASNWLAHIDSRYRLPPRIQSQYLMSYELGKLRGVTVPTLLYARGGAVAKVVVINVRQFRDAATLPNGRAAENSVCTVLTLRDPEHNDVVYLIEVINGPVEQFFANDDATVA